MARPDRSRLLESGARVLEIEAEALAAGAGRLGDGFVAAVEVILARSPPGRVVVTGMGKSGHVGGKIAASLASTGTPAFFVHPAEAGHGDLGMITRQDVVLAISQSGKSDELLRVVPYLKRNRIELIALTGVLDSPLARHATAVIDASVRQEACPLGLAPTASTTLALALGDALAICLLEARGFTSADFAATHPHGALGRRLLVSVGDVMVRGAAAPTVSVGTTLREALVEMSRGGLGFVCIRDADARIAGVFTDGDLRRALDHDVDIKRTPIDAAMIKEFVYVRADQLAVEAVELMERRKVSALPVLDDAGRLAGAINMRLILQAGVI